MNKQQQEEISALREYIQKLAFRLELASYYMSPGKFESFQKACGILKLSPDISAEKAMQIVREAQADETTERNQSGSLFPANNLGNISPEN